MIQCEALRVNDVRPVGAEVTLYEIVDRSATISSIPLALIGFGVTIWQLVKTRDAAQAAKVAAEQTRGQIRRISLVGLLPQLQRIEIEVRRAVRSGSMETLEYWLTTWRWQAGQARTYLDEGRATEKKLMRLLQAGFISGSMDEEIVGGTHFCRLNLNPCMLKRNPGLNLIEFHTDLVPGLDRNAAKLGMGA